MDEFLRRIFAVIHSNDPVARALTLRTLGLIASIVPEKKQIHHTIRNALDSHESVELAAAIFAAGKLFLKIIQAGGRTRDLFGFHLFSLLVKKCLRALGYCAPSASKLYEKYFCNAAMEFLRIKDRQYFSLIIGLTVTLI